MLFPNVFLPLHIFEPRYREMVADALDGDRIIGMVLLRPGWEADYEGRPPVYPIGCAGVDHARRAARRRPLQHRPAGAREVPRSLDEDDGRAYRLARVDEHRRAAGRRATAKDDARRRGAGSKRCWCRSRDGRGGEPKVPPSMADEDLVNALAQYLELEPVEKQALLERDGLLARCRSLIELLEMKVIVARHKWGSDGSH